MKNANVLFNKFNLVLLATVLIFSAVIISCNKNDKKAGSTPEQNATKLPGNKSNSQSDIIVGDIQVSNKAHQKASPIESKGLNSYMPPSIPGTRRFPPKIGTIDGKNNQVTTVTVEYPFTNKGVAVFSITDYGNLANIPEQELSIFKKIPEGMETEFEILKLPDGKGLINFSEKTRYGNFYGLIEERYIIRIEVINLPKDALSIQELYNRIKVKEMISQGAK